MALGCVAMLWALLATSCQKDVSYQTSVVVKAWAQESSGGEQHRLDDVVVYGFAADTTLYAVTDYEEALAGVMRRKSDPTQSIEAQLKGSEATLEGHGMVQVMPAHDYSSLILLVVDTENRLFGYTQLALVENLPYMYISVQFQPWKESAHYKNGQWWMYNSYYVANLSCTVRPKKQMEQEGEETYLTSSRLFAYEVEEPERWLPKDWNDAEVGRLTHTETGEIADPAYSFAADNQGAVTAKFPPRDYLVMVVNSLERCYALRALSEEEIRAEAESTAEVRGFSVVFPLWNLRPPHHTEDGWSCYYTPEVLIPIQTTIQRSHDQAAEPLTGATLYAYRTATPEVYRPATLAAAAEGVVTDSTTGEELSPDLTLPFEKESRVTASLPIGDYLLLVVHPTEGCYALRALTPEEVEVSFDINFPVTRRELPFVDDQGWEIFYTPNLKGSVTLYVERENPNPPSDEGTGEATTRSYPPYTPTPDEPVRGTRLEGSILHAFVDSGIESPELWLPRNLSDLSEGRLQNTASGEFLTADYTFTADNSGTIEVELPYGDYLLMTGNFNEGCYALRSWSHRHPKLEAAICFPIWQSDFPQTDAAGWCCYYTPNVRASIEVTVQFAEDQEPKKLDRTLLHIYPQPQGDGWAPADFAAAVEGRIRNAETGEELLPEQSYEAERDETLLEINLLRGDYLLLVVGYYNCYALHTLSASDTGIQIPLNFQLWRSERPYTDEVGWSVYSYYETPANDE